MKLVHMGKKMHSTKLKSHGSFLCFVFFVFLWFALHGCAFFVLVPQHGERGWNEAKKTEPRREQGGSEALKAGSEPRVRPQSRERAGSEASKPGASRERRVPDNKTRKKEKPVECFFCLVKNAFRS